MDNYKKILLITSLICITIAFVSLVQTYAKYLTAASGTASIPIARWNIKINNESIQNQNNFSNTIQPVFPGNAHIASGIIAPTAEGYFDLQIDYTEVDVSFNCTIQLEPNINSSVKDLVVTGYSYDNGTTIQQIQNPSTQTTLQVATNLTDQPKTKNIRIYVKWDDNINTALMNNIEDTLATKSNTNALLNVTVSFIQTI